MKYCEMTHFLPRPFWSSSSLVLYHIAIERWYRPVQHWGWRGSLGQLLPGLLAQTLLEQPERLQRPWYMR